MTGKLTFDVSVEDEGQRLDIYLAHQLPAYSRMLLRKAIVDQLVQVDGRPVKASFKLRAGHHIEIQPPELPQDGPTPESIPLDILYEDEHMVAINKRPAMVVHPARGHWSGTLTNALAHHFQQLSDAGGAARPGIVHRLDRDTSGVILVAKTNTAHFALADMFEQRKVKKVYLALVAGVPDRDRDVIEQPIGAHPYQREKMAIRRSHPTSREAETYFEVRRRWRSFALVEVHPRTGRTHQIRVHLSHIGCPVLCDRLYGGRSQVTRGELTGTDDQQVALDRQALHAARIELAHPVTAAPLVIEAPLADDLQAVIDLLG